MPPTRWVDQRESAAGEVGAGAVEQIGDLRRSHGEPDPEQVPMRSDDPFDFVARERKDDRHDARRPPSEPPCRLPCHSFVPAQLPLECTEIVDTRLDLDDEQGLRPRVEGEKIDPAV
jgi:hypothetical protein